MTSVFCLREILDDLPLPGPAEPPRVLRDLRPELHPGVYTRGSPAGNRDYHTLSSVQGGKCMNYQYGRFPMILSRPRGLRVAWQECHVETGLVHNGSSPVRAGKSRESCRIKECLETVSSRQLGYVRSWYFTAGLVTFWQLCQGGIRYVAIRSRFVLAAKSRKVISRQDISRWVEAVSVSAPCVTSWRAAMSSHTLLSRIALRRGRNVWSWYLTLIFVWFRQPCHPREPYVESRPVEAGELCYALFSPVTLVKSWQSRS